MINSSSWFVQLRYDPTYTSSIFLLPYAGGGVSLYRRWLEWLTLDANVYGVQLPGREERMGEGFLTDMGDCVNGLVAEIHPFLSRKNFFFGYSLGAHIAFNSLLRLERLHGIEVDGLVCAATSAPLVSRRKSIHALPDDEFLQEVIKMNGIEEELISNEELMELMLPRLRADFTIYGTMRTLDSGYQVKCPIVAFGGSDDVSVSLDGLTSWKAHTTNEFDHHLFQGDHFFINTQGAALFEKTTEYVGRFL